MGKNLKVLVSLFLFCLLSQGVWALVFTAKDKAFTIDLPSTWTKVESQDYLFLKNKSGATMRFVSIDNCAERACLDKIIEKEISDLTKRKFHIIKSEYTGETIKEIGFSTGDPLLSFDFTKQDMLFTAGYFLSGGKAFNVGVRNIPATEAAYLLSFISPVPKSEQNEEVLQEDLLSDNKTAELEDVEQTDLLAVEPVKKLEEKPKIQVRKQENPKLKLSQKTLQIIILILLCYFMLLGFAFVYKMLFSPKYLQENTNPSSPYPLQGRRLYGSPDLFFRLHNNQGNHYIATCTRWGGLFAFGGLAAFLLFSLARLVFSIIVLKTEYFSLLINTFYSLSYLFSACGLVVFIAGIILNLLFPYKFLIYNSQGELVFKCVQKGFSLLGEQYFVADTEGQILCKVIRKNFCLLRTWKIFDADKEIAQIKEKSIIKSLLRRMFGHLFGILRANYIIKAQMDSSGEIKSLAKPCAKFSVYLDKPQAIAADVMLVFSAVLFLRDRDKIFPWIN